MSEASHRFAEEKSRFEKLDSELRTVKNKMASQEKLNQLNSKTVCQPHHVKQLSQGWNRGSAKIFEQALPATPSQGQLKNQLDKVYSIKTEESLHHHNTSELIANNNFQTTENSRPSISTNHANFKKGDSSASRDNLLDNKSALRTILKRLNPVPNFIDNNGVPRVSSNNQRETYHCHQVENQNNMTFLEKRSIARVKHTRNESEEHKKPRGSIEGGKLAGGSGVGVGVMGHKRKITLDCWRQQEL